MELPLIAVVLVAGATALTSCGGGDGHAQRAAPEQAAPSRDGAGTNPRDRVSPSRRMLKGHRFPSRASTGVPRGTKLTPYTGPDTIATAGTAIDGKSLGCIQVAAPHVVIRNSRITCPGGGVHVSDGPGGASLLLEDSEISCGGGGGTGIGEANVTVRRAWVHGCENGFDLNQNILIEDSYIGPLLDRGGTDAHEDGIQLACGRYEAGSGHHDICGNALTDYVPGSKNITIRHNTIYGLNADGSFGTSAIISNRASDHDILIEDNLLAGGAYTLYCDPGAKSANYRVLDNHFSTRFKSSVGYFGRSTDCADMTQSGNVIHETGRPVHLG